MNWADYVYYDETSPTCLRWKIDIMAGRGYKQVRCAKGVAAGSKMDHGYWNVNVTPRGKPRVYKSAHRIVWELHFGEVESGFEVDHNDGNQDNSRIGNLRKVPKAVNARNVRKQKRREFDICGVHWREPKPGRLVSTAKWSELDGTPRSKSFSVAKYGLLPAYALAVRAREAAIEGLKSRGAGYTERHGT